MSNIFVAKLDEIQPSQLFISSEKLSKVMKSFDSLRLETLDPIPVKNFGNQVIFTDGHTRVLAAYLCGLSEVRVFWDEDNLVWEEYKICVKWCREQGIFTIANLKDRVVNPEKYKVLWLERCKVMQQGLEMRRNQE